MAKPRLEAVTPPPIITPQGVHIPTDTARKVEFKPLGDRYLCKIIDAKEIMPPSPGNIIMPDDLEKTLGWRPCVVLAVGDGHLLEREETVRMAYKKGDHIMVYWASGNVVLMNGVRYLVVSQKDVLGLFDTDLN